MRQSERRRRSHCAKNERSPVGLPHEVLSVVDRSGPPARYCLAGSGRDEVRAAKLFAGIEGKTLLAASERAAAASSDSHVGDADRRLRKSTGDTPYRFWQPGRELRERSGDDHCTLAGYGKPAFFHCGRN